MALCIPFELSDGIFELYHSGLMTLHQGLTRTYYKIRQDFFIRYQYKYLETYTLWVVKHGLKGGTYSLIKNNALGHLKLYMTLSLWSLLVWTSKWYSLLSFSIKTIISDLKLLPKNCKCHLLDRYTSFLNFIYLLSTINGEVIEQTFHVSCLKWGLLRLPNGNYVQNINYYKLEMIRLCNKDFVQPEHMHLIAHKPLSKLCSMFTVMNLFISLMTQILLISGVNLLQFSRWLLWTERLIYYILTN